MPIWPGYDHIESGRIDSSPGTVDFLPTEGKFYPHLALPSIVAIPLSRFHSGKFAQRATRVHLEMQDRSFSSGVDQFDQVTGQKVIDTVDDLKLSKPRLKIFYLEKSLFIEFIKALLQLYYIIFYLL